GDVEGDVADELLEVLVARDEVRLAVDLHQHADLAAGMDVARHRALGRGATASLGGLRLALHAQDLDGLLHIAALLGQGGLAIHHPRAGAVAQGLYILRTDVGRCSAPCSARAGCSGAGCSAGASSAAGAAASAGAASSVACGPVASASGAACCCCCCSCA